MLHKFRFAAHRMGVVSALIPLYMLLSACGGGGAAFDVASIPPPPPPPPTPPPTAATPLRTIQGYSLKGSLDVQTSWLNSPATRAGIYDLIGRLTVGPGNGAPVSSRNLAPGEFTLTLTNPTGQAFNYLLHTPVGILPGGLTSVGPAAVLSSWDINQNVAYRYDNPYEDPQQSLGQRLTAFDKAADGSETQLFSYDFTRGSAETATSLGSGNSLRTTLDYDIGYSYVAMGEWSWRMVDLNGATVPGSDSGDLLFVNGDRTPASGIPVSGTATYDARALAMLSSSAAFTLTADFGQRTMSTRIDQDYRYNPNGDIMDYPLASGIHVGGTSAFSNDGSFDIPLSGTANFGSGYALNPPETPPSQPVTGDMNGAFFGPSAQQVGGVLNIVGPGGVQLMQDAFVGQQRQP